MNRIKLQYFQCQPNSDKTLRLSGSAITEGGITPMPSDAANIEHGNTPILSEPAVSGPEKNSDVMGIVRCWAWEISRYHRRGPLLRTEILLRYPSLLVRRQTWRVTDWPLISCISVLVLQPVLLLPSAYIALPKACPVLPTTYLSCSSCFLSCSSSNISCLSCGLYTLPAAYPARLAASLALLGSHCRN